MSDETKKKAISEEELKELRNLASSVAKDAADFVKKYPLQSLAGAALLGFILGNLRKR